MHVLFEVFLAPGHTCEGLLTPETMQDTMAQVMTPEQAKAVGFDGLPEPPEGVRTCFIVVAHNDRKRIMNVLEHQAQVARFALHEINL